MIVDIPLEKITANPWQTRQGEPDPEYIRDLAGDIARNGLLQTPIGRLIVDDKSVDPQPYVSGVGAFYCPDGRVQLAFGHNRLAAFRWLDAQPPDAKYHFLPTMPVDIRELDDAQMADFAWSENEKRREHTPYERALAIRRRMDDFKWSQAQAAEHLGLSRSAVSNVLRLLKLPADVLDALAKGQISERVAMALVSLFDLPESLRKRAEDGYNYSPSDITRRALSGEYTSDRVRELTNGLCGSYGRRLDDAIWPLEEVFAIENIQSPACKDCPSRFAERNVCLVLECFKLKEEAARIAYLAKAGEVCGIPPLESDRYGYGDVTSFTWYGSKNKHFEAIRQSGCGNLRLKYEKDSRSNPNHLAVEIPDRVPGFPFAQIVCGRKEQFCTCLKGLNYAEEAKEGTNGSKPADISQAPADAEQLKELARAARAEKRDVNRDAKDILRETAERIAAGLATNNHKTWKRLAQEVAYRSKEIDGRDLFALQVGIAMKIAEPKLPYQITTYKGVLDNMNKLLKECDLEPIAWNEQPAADVPAPEDQPAGKTLTEVFTES